ncbi:hypothetical protein LXA43DRAFT_1063384 [Ganoderma leucocontextum]|nr:hypothetical protein LXA43DRAFT_1063384 [Ganoderma leucocontextum]
MPMYHTPSTMGSRLLHILARMDRQISSGSSDLTILEIKSRRRLLRQPRCLRAVNPLPWRAPDPDAGRLATELQPFGGRPRRLERGLRRGGGGGGGDDEHMKASFYQMSSRGYSLDDNFEDDDESWREVHEFTGKGKEDSSLET